MKKIILFTVLILLLAACGKTVEKTDAPETDVSKLQIYTTVYPLAYFTERIGGDRVEVQSIYPASANEHTFEPTQQEMIALAESDLMFYIGLGLEGFIDSAKDTLKNENVQFVATSEYITDEELEAADVHEEEGHSQEEETDVHEEEGHSHEEETESHEGHDHGSTDPHVWMSPKLSQDLAEAIVNSLSEADPEGAELFEKNYEDLIAEFEELDQQFAELHERVSRNTFFVSHSAFGYIAEPYELEQVAIAGLNSQDEPSQRELTQIVDQAKENNIQYIVFEQNVSSNLTEVIQKEIGAEAVEMHNLGVLTQEDIDNNETYFTLMERNLQVLETVLE